MGSNNKVDYNLRKGQAADKAKKLQAKIKLVEYRIEDDDAVILSGPYMGKTIKSIWFLGEAERDYIVKNFCMRNDSKIVEIVRQLCGQ